ncbi:MAG: FHA domain-containing protein [Prochloraceae cyanobacterium]
MLSTSIKLIINKENEIIKDFVFARESIAIGRAPDNQVVLTEPSISRYHAEIINNNGSGKYKAIDLGSSCGTYLNNKKLIPHQAEILNDGDTIEIGGYKLQFTTELGVVAGKSSDKPATLYLPEADFQTTDFFNEETLQPLNLKGRDNISIGRDPNNDVSIDHPTVSRYHAKIERENGSFYLFDLNSTNGTFVNGKQVRDKRVLKVGDTIHIGSSSLILNINEQLIRYNEQGKLRLDAVNLNKVVGKNLNLLNNISLSFPPRQFVVIAGVSGGGKSTLLDALNGFRPATSGKVLVNGTNLYRNFDSYRTQIGYVPQKDIVHMELTVFEALDYAAQLRMPADTTKAERRKRIAEVLEDLDLTHRQHVQIKALSGGQLKRVSIGVELLTQPNLFFLDEATSGLDPGTEGDIMRLLRELADRGRTVTLITHATDNVMLCDLVVFMAKGGNLAYFGPPKEALEYFGVSKFNEIYLKVEREKTPPQWQEQYLQSPQYEKHVIKRQAQINYSTDNSRLRTPRKNPSASKHISSWRQFLILSRRNLNILIRDRASLILMLAIAPILGILDFFIWKHDMFDVTDGDPGQVMTMLFTTALFAVMVGSLATMREIVKEQDIYKRERTIGLQIIPYILSKVWVAVILALYQGAIFLLSKFIVVDMPRSPQDLLQFYITVVLATLAGMVMGLLVSAVSPNQNIAPLLTIVFLVPQILFGGGLLSVQNAGLPAQLLNNFSLTKWSFESLVTITDYGKDIAADPCWHKLTAEQRENLTETEAKKCNCLERNMFKMCEFPGIRSNADSVLNKSEPEKPTEPEEPPTAPNKPQVQSQQANLEYQLALDEYINEVKNYLEQIEQYQENIDSWQEKYTKWKGQTEGAIGEAEGILGRFYEKYGSMYDVDLISHWTKLTGLIAVMFCLIIWSQKRKDIV